MVLAPEILQKGNHFMEKTSLITNPKVTGYLNRFYSPESQELMELRIGAEEAQIPIILRETEDFLNVLLSILQPERILEIGTAVGYSAAYFAKKTGAHVITIEKSEEMFRIAEENVKKLGLEDSIRLLPGDGEEEIKKLAEAGEKPFDFLFIDAAKSHYKRFLDAAMPLTHPGSVIVSDNVLFRGSVAEDEEHLDRRHKTNIRRLQEYMEYIYHHPALETSLIACGDGLAISRVREKNQI